MIDWILEPLRYGFMLRGILAAVMVGAVCAVVGSYVVLRGMAFYGGALAHTILPGVALGYIMGNGERKFLFWGGLFAALISAFSISLIRNTAKIKEDTAIGIIFAGMFALGIAIISTVNNYSVDLTHLLFGDILSVTNQDLIRTGSLGTFILLVVVMLYKEFMVISFDPILAVTLRMKAKVLDILLMVLTALAIVISLQTVGVALMVAMLVTPAATAYLLARRLSSMMWLAVLDSIISGILGLYISYYIGIASGAAIVLVTTAIFCFVWLGKTLLHSRVGTN